MRNHGPSLRISKPQEIHVATAAKPLLKHVKHVPLFTAEKGNDAGINVFVGQQPKLAEIQAGTSTDNMISFFMNWAAYSSACSTSSLPSC